MSQGARDGGSFSVLRAVALAAVLVGAVGSVGLMLGVGHRNPSLILLALFMIWVLSPFVGVVLLAKVVPLRWSSLTPVTLYSLMLVLTLGSLAAYGNVAFGPPRAKAASTFLIVPLASWLLIGVTVLLAVFISGRQSRPDAQRQA